MHMRKKLRHKGNPKDLLLRQQCKHEMTADRKHTAKSENKIMFILCKMKITDDKDSVGGRHFITEMSPYSFGNFRKLSLYSCFMPI